MNIEDELKHKACNIDLFAKKAAEDVAALGQYSGWLLNRANQVQMEMEMLREKNKKLKEALERIGTGELITTQRGTIFIDREETTTLQDFALDVLKEGMV